MLNKLPCPTCWAEGPNADVKTAASKCVFCVERCEILSLDLPSIGLEEPQGRWAPAPAGGPLALLVSGLDFPASGIESPDNGRL